MSFNFFGSLAIHALIAKFQVVVKIAFAVERFFHVQGVFCEVLFKKMNLLRMSSISFAGVITLKTLCYSYQRKRCFRRQWTVM